MVIGRLKDAVSDVTETIRRAFRDPACHAVRVALRSPGTSLVEPLVAVSRQPSYGFEAVPSATELEFSRMPREAPMRFEARLLSENAWAAWAAGARVCGMPVFRAGSCGRLAVPPLPRAGAVRRPDLPSFRATARWLREAMPVPPVRGLSPALEPPRIRRGLEVVLAMPIAIPGEDFQSLPKALNMRYTFQLVKATGENIRNLHVLGVYPLPVRGVDSLSHDARTGRLLVNLGPEAAGAKRGRFILARRKDDRSFVSCFVED